MKNFFRLFVVMLSLTKVSYAQFISLDQLINENPSVTAHEKFNETFELAGLGFSDAKEHRFSMIMEASSCTKGVTFFIDFPNQGIENRSYLKQTHTLSKADSEKAEISLFILILSGRAMQAGDKSLSKKFMKKLKKVCDINSEDDANEFGKDISPLIQRLGSIVPSSDVVESTSDRDSGKEVNEPASRSSDSSVSRVMQQ